MRRPKALSPDERLAVQRKALARAVANSTMARQPGSCPVHNCGRRPAADGGPCSDCRQVLHGYLVSK